MSTPSGWVFSNFAAQIIIATGTPIPGQNLENALCCVKYHETETTQKIGDEILAYSVTASCLKFEPCEEKKKKDDNK